MTDDLAGSSAVWDALADAKGALRAAWDDDRDTETLRHVDFIDEQLRWDLPGPVLEIGAGPGRLTRPIAARHPDRLLIAIEPSRRMRAPLIADLPDNVMVRPDPYGLDPSGDHPFAGAYTMLTLQHLDDSQAHLLLEAAARLLAPRARLIAQFTRPLTDGDTGPLSHPRDPGDIFTLTESLFAARETFADPLEPAWVWLAGIARP